MEYTIFFEYLILLIMDTVHKKSLARLKQRVQATWNRANIEQLEEAFVFGFKAHEGEIRRSGRPYFLTHCIPVAWICSQWAFGEKLIIAALLHDTIENTDTSASDIRRAFGPRVSHIVNSVTKITKYVHEEERLRTIETLVKLFRVGGKDYRPYLLKIADRLHNMRTLYFLKPAQQRRIAQQTLEIYAPIAHRLGMQKIRRRLEDYAFYYLNRDMYQHIQKRCIRHSTRRLKTYHKVHDVITHSAEKEHIPITIKLNPSYIYTIFQRMQTKSFHDIYTNFISFRLITRNLMDCFTILDLITEQFGSVIKPPKDFFYAAKSNEYSALHAVVAGPGKQQLQFLICTEELEEVAEHGIVALRQYRMGAARIDDWFRATLENIAFSKDAEETLEILRMDLFGDEITTYSPKGKIIRLPKGSSCLDFAFALHTELGLHCSGAKVNDIAVPITTELRREDVVYIETAPDAHPSAEWEHAVKTSKAKTTIRLWLKQHSH